MTLLVLRRHSGRFQWCEAAIRAMSFPRGQRLSCNRAMHRRHYSGCRRIAMMIGVAPDSCMSSIMVGIVRHICTPACLLGTRLYRPCSPSLTGPTTTNQPGIVPDSWTSCALADILSLHHTTTLRNLIFCHLRPPHDLPGAFFSSRIHKFSAHSRHSPTVKSQSWRSVGSHICL